VGNETGIVLNVQDLRLVARWFANSFTCSLFHWGCMSRPWFSVRTNYCEYSVPFLSVYVAFFAFRWRILSYYFKSFSGYFKCSKPLFDGLFFGKLMLLCLSAKLFVCQLMLVFFPTSFGYQLFIRWCLFQYSFPTFWVIVD
jgi:hypothetical protein